MPKEFVRDKIGSSGIAKAIQQQKQLAYFTKSEIQDNVTQEYLEAWVNRQYSTDDHFLNFVKSVFKTDNFLSFYKYFRHPISSAELINDRIKNPLNRVFYSEDSYFKYNIKGESYENIPELNSEDWDSKLFNALLFNHNDIVITGVSDVNKSFREIVSIENVISIDSKDGVINKIAYTAEYQGEKGYMYLDSERYAFYNTDYIEIADVPHDLGECPADYIAKDSYKDEDVIRLSRFTYLRSTMEEYTFLKTLQRMTDPNGAIPIITKLKTKENSDKKDIKGTSNLQPMSATIGGQQAEFKNSFNQSQGVMQTGSVYEVPVSKKDDNSLDMDIINNFVKFHFMPIESLNYLKDRIKEIEESIIVSALGDYSEHREEAKNRLQVSKSYVSKEDKLRGLSIELSRIRTLSDRKLLALQYGKDQITVECFFGSDFFTESQQDIYDLYEKSPNPIERRNLLIRLTRNRNRFNRQKMEREVLLYNLLPFSADEDFDKYLKRGLINNTIFAYQTQFSYWISKFEAKYGDLMEFYSNASAGNKNENDSTKILFINNLITQIIVENEQKPSEANSPSEVV